MSRLQNQTRREWAQNPELEVRRREIELEEKVVQSVSFLILVTSGLPWLTKYSSRQRWLHSHRDQNQAYPYPCNFSKAPGRSTHLTISSRLRPDPLPIRHPHSDGRWRLVLVLVITPRSSLAQVCNDRS
jgi:hypothetical protein